MKDYPAWLRLAASKGGKKSKRTLTPEDAKAMVRAREKKRRATKRAARLSNARADLPRIEDANRESGCEGNNRG